MLALGLDIGYAATKGCNGQDTVVFPSLVGSPDERIFSLQAEDGILLEAPVRCQIGADVVFRSLWQRRRQDRAWWRESEWQALFAAALSELVPYHPDTPPEPAVLVLGLPVSWYLADKPELREKALGEHRIRRLGRDVQTVYVADARVLPQGIGIAMDAIFDAQGQVADRNLFDARLGIIDIGGNTVNLVDITQLRVGEASASRAIGCWRAVTALRRRLDQELPGVELTDHQLAGVLVDGVITADGRPVELRYEINAILDDMAAAIAAELSQLWGSARHLDRILIGGGGAHLVADRLAARYPQARAVAEPQTANARGYHRFARRLAAARGVSHRIKHTVTHPDPEPAVPHA